MTEFDHKNKTYKHENICVSTITNPANRYNEVRSRLLELIFAEGYGINPDATHANASLDRIHSETVIPSDAFILLPIPRGKHLTDEEKEIRMKELFKAASLVVGLQTDDPYMHLDPRDMQSPTKPIIIVDQINNLEDQTWRAFHDMLHGLHKAGTVKSHPDTLVTFVEKPEDVLLTLRAHMLKPPKITSIANSPCATHCAPKDAEGEFVLPKERRVSERPKPVYNVCVFLSASSSNVYFIEIAYEMGRLIAEEEWGLISGAGSTSMMGSIIKGAVAGGGWTGGTTMEYIARHEGIPPNLDQFWYNEDIYTRMKDMIEASNSFVILPSGMGTVQELFTLLLLKHEKNPLMAGADIIICNEKGFWEPLINLIHAYGFDDEVHIVDSVVDVVPMLKALRSIRETRRGTIDVPEKNLLTPPNFEGADGMEERV